MLLLFLTLTGVSLIATVAYLLEKKAVTALVFGITAFICSVPLLPAWYYALVTSGKNTAWLGFERYPFVAVGLFALTVMAVLCIVKSGLLLKKRKGNPKHIPGYVIKTKEDDAIVQNRAKIRAEIERNIVPCAKTKEEFRSYLVDTLGMKEVPISEFELRDAKVQFIFKLCPELLRTPMCSVKEDRIAMLQSLTERRKEAQNISLEQTGFEITKYAMEYYVDDYKLADVTVFLEENSFTYYASGESYVRNDEDDRIVRHLFDNIILFRGVTAEDIETTSERYGAYVSLLTAHALEMQGERSNDG